MNKDLVNTALLDIINVAASIAMDIPKTRKQTQINKFRAAKLKESYDVLKLFIEN
jgi:hypothetical protein